MAYGFCLLADLFLMRFELRSDDAGVLVLFVLVTTMVLGSLHPRRAWQWALMVGPCVPAAELAFGSGHPPFDALDAVKLLAFLVAVGMVGTYLGVLGRKTLSAAVGIYR